MNDFIIVSDVEKRDKKILVRVEDITFVNEVPGISFSVIFLMNSTKISCRENAKKIRELISLN